MNSSASGTPHKSNFSQKCTLFSQYLKENGSFGDLSLGLLPKQHGNGQGSSNDGAKSRVTEHPTTKDFLPMIEKSAAPVGLDLNLSPKVGEKEKSHMTIFYGGKVIVFEDFSEEKAKEIMGFAQQNSKMTTIPAPNTPFNNPLAEGDMPIMRNRSLARFIAKRKDRIRAKAPYQTINGQDESTSKPVDNNKTWLALAAQSSSQKNELQFL